MSQPQTQNIQLQETAVCTDQPQASNIQPQGTSVCTDQPQASNIQPQGTSVSTDQPQASNPQPELTVNEVHLEHTSEPQCPETVPLSKPAPVKRKAAVNVTPRTYLPLSVFSCICCFWPTGACALIYSLKTSAMIDDGDMEGARSASKKALVLDIISIAVMVCLILAILIGIYT